MSGKLLTEHHLDFLSLKGGCTSPSESTLVKMPHCWKSLVAAHFCNMNIIIDQLLIAIRIDLDLSNYSHLCN